MIGKSVRYKDKPNKEYIVIDYSPKTDEYPAEICILEEFAFAGDIEKQLKIWQSLDRFDVIED